MISTSNRILPFRTITVSLLYVYGWMRKFSISFLIIFIFNYFFVFNYWINQIPNLTFSHSQVYNQYFHFYNLLFLSPYFKYIHKHKSIYFKSNA